MSKGNTFENDLLLLIFNGTTIADIAENDTTSPATNLYIALHTADPGEAGSQTTSETAYTGYARVAVARTSGGFNVSSGAVNLVANCDFGICTASAGGPITHFSVGTASSGAGKILYKGTVTPNITMAVSVIPRLTTAANFVTED
jgi:hypothetical protein